MIVLTTAESPVVAATALLGDAVLRLRHNDDATLLKVGRLEARRTAIEALGPGEEADALAIELQLDIAIAFPASLGRVPVAEGEDLHRTYESIGRRYFDGAAL